MFRPATFVQHPISPSRKVQFNLPGVTTKFGSRGPILTFSMSILPHEVHAALASLLQGLSSPDNQIRTHAEEQLNSEWIAARPDVLLMGLVEQIQSAQVSSVWHLPSFLSIYTPHLADPPATNRLALSQQSSFVECQQRQEKRRGPRSQKSCSCYYGRPKRWP